jgi:hypothetical protein
MRQRLQDHGCSCSSWDAEGRDGAAEDRGRSEGRGAAARGRGEVRGTRLPACLGGREAEGRGCSDRRAVTEVRCTRLPVWAAGKWRDGAAEDRGDGAECRMRAALPVLASWMGDEGRVGDGESRFERERGLAGWVLGVRVSVVYRLADWAGPTAISGRSVGLDWLASQLELG